MNRSKLKHLLLLVSVGFHLLTTAQLTTLHKKIPQTDRIYKSYPGPDGIHHCSTMERDSIRRANDPTLPTFEQEQEWIEQKIRENKSNGTVKVQYTIPIIFHIFTDGVGAENLAASYIQAQVNQLNLDYANMSGSSYSQAANCQITFCLAMVDPNGNPLSEPGIHRVTTYGGGPFSDTQMDNTYKAATSWDPNRYFNVWVVDLSGGLLGYAQFPNSSGITGLNTNNGPASTDGVVVNYYSVGSLANPNPNGGNYAYGRTLTHEAGHWLGLLHIWGDASNCTQDDYCNDTPMASAPNYGCSPHVSCSSQDMIENYMDYTDDGCMNTFTANQKTRIQTVMTNSPRRGILNSSNVCSGGGSSCTVTASADQTICAGSSVILTATGATSYTWNNGAGSGASVTVSPSTTTTYTVTGTTGSCTSTDQVTVTVNSSGTPVTITIHTDCYGEEVQWQLFNQGTSNLVAEGGNLNYTGGAGQQPTDPSDPGAYPSSTTINETLCLTSSNCYDFVIYDSYGDGMSGCSPNGSWSITGQGSATLAQMTASGGNYGFEDNASFCLSSSSCTVTASADQTICAGSSVTLTATGTTSYTWNNGAGSGASVTVSPSSTTTYTVTGTSGSCTSTDQVTVTVNSVPNVNAGVDQTICSGASATLAATGASTYSWNNGAGNGASVTVSPSTTTTYTVTGTTGSCTSTDQVTVTVNSAPNVNAGADQTICPSASATLAATGASTYSWSNGAGSGASVTVSPSSTTTYTVTGTSGSCTNTDQVTITVSSTLNVNAGTDQTICAGNTVTLSASGASTYSWNNGAGNGANVTVTPSSTTTYTVTGTSSSCTGTDQITVTVNPAPIVNTGADQTICQGTSATLSANGANTYSWSNGAGSGANVTVTPSGTTTYTVTGTANGCTDTDQITVFVYPNPVVSITPSSVNAMCINSPAITLTGSPIGGIFSGNGVSGNTFSPVNAGVGTHTITYNYTDGNGCSGTATLSAVVDGCVGISEQSQATISLFPNPNNGTFVVTGLENGTKIHIYDARGRLILESNTNSEEYEIQLPDLESGVYYLRTNNNASENNLKFLIIR